MTKKAVLLDVDGTLIDSNDAHAMAWVDALREFDYEVPFDRIRRLIGKGGDELLSETVGLDRHSRQGNELSNRRAELFRTWYLPKIAAFDGTRPLVRALKERNLRVVVATSATREEANALLDIADVRDLVDELRTSEDVEESKPDPDIVFTALSAAGCRASEAVMLGDTPWDVEAASRAGVTTVAVRCGGWDDESLQGAAAIYDDPRDVLAHLETSPFLGRGPGPFARLSRPS
jgi:HAD superfamily hydrolase (TIGR01509 family)